QHNETQLDAHASLKVAPMDPSGAPLGVTGNALTVTGGPAPHPGTPASGFTYTCANNTMGGAPAQVLAAAPKQRVYHIHVFSKTAAGLVTGFDGTDNTGPQVFSGYVTAQSSPT